MQGFRSSSWHAAVHRLGLGFPVSKVAPPTGGEVGAVLYLLCTVTAEILGPPGLPIQVPHGKVCFPRSVAGVIFMMCV